MLIASLDPAVARRILDHQPIAGIEICRDQTLARMDQHPAQLITKQWDTFAGDPTRTALWRNAQSDGRPH
jgi:hypothetical protein